MGLSGLLVEASGDGHIPMWSLSGLVGGRGRRESQCCKCGLQISIHDLSPHKTLPPIKHQSLPSQPACWNLQIPKEKAMWQYPQAPPPSLLYLGLTARAHSIDSFLDNFFSSFPSYFLHW